MVTAEARPKAPTKFVWAIGLAVGAGLYALSFPPFDFAACGWVALLPLLLVVRNETPLRALAYGVLYGSTSAWAVGWWLPQAGVGYLGMSLPVAVIASYAYAIVCWGSVFGLFGSGAAVLYRAPQVRLRRLTIAALWVGTEFVRARLIGQPWALLGYTQHRQTGLIQVAAVTGVFGISFLLALANISFAEIFARMRARATWRSIAITSAAPALLILTVWSAGTVVSARGPVGGFAGHTVTVVQTGLAPSYVWTRSYADKAIGAHLRATAEISGVHPRLIVWPEHAVPRYLEQEPMLERQLSQVAEAHGADLLIGGPRFSEGKTFNSVRLITAEGREGGYYDKQRLVPFAEASPFASAFGAQPSESPEHFSSGSQPGVLRSFVALGVTVCHEILYPALVSRTVLAGAKLLVNVSNDGWLDGGFGTASRQHFAMVVFRAVETRRYLVRAATTGISGVVDPYGRVLEELAPGAAGVLSASVAGRGTLTFYVRYGDIFALACAILALSALYAERPIFAWRRARLASAPA